MKDDVSTNPQHSGKKDVSGGLSELLDQNVLHKLTRQGQPDLCVGVRLCRQDELSAILELQSKVSASISNKSTFVVTTEDELAESLNTDICIGMYHEAELIAFTLIITNSYSLRNLGFYIGYSRERCKRCVSYDTTFVHPAYKGYGIQRLFIGLKDAAAISLGAAEALATVSPDNDISLKNLISSGFVVVEEKKMYGGFNRYIVRKSLM